MLPSKVCDDFWPQAVSIAITHQMISCKSNRKKLAQTRKKWLIKKIEPISMVVVEAAVKSFSLKKSCPISHQIKVTLPPLYSLFSLEGMSLAPAPFLHSM